MAPVYTPRQGRFLAFIDSYTRLNGRPPSEQDMQDYFRITAPAVHQMVLTLEKRGLIARTPGKPRSIGVLLSKEEMPDADTGRPAVHLQEKDRAVERLYPSVAHWVAEQGWIEIGQQEQFGFTVRALDPGGMVCEFHRVVTLGDALARLERRLRVWLEREGIGVE